MNVFIKKTLSSHPKLSLVACRLYSGPSTGSGTE